MDPTFTVTLRTEFTMPRGTTVLRDAIGRPECLKLPDGRVLMPVPAFELRDGREGDPIADVSHENDLAKLGIEVVGQISPAPHEQVEMDEEA